MTKCTQTPKQINELLEKFAQDIAENHYRLYNIENGEYFWKNDNNIKTTKQLLRDFKKK